MHSDLSSRLNSSTTKTSGNGYFDIETLLKNLFGNLCSLKLLETFPQDFLEILKRSLQNFLKTSKKCFLGTTCIVIYLAIPGRYKSVVHKC